MHLPAAIVLPSKVINTSCNSPVEESTAQSYNKGIDLAKVSAKVSKDHRELT